MQDCRVQDFTRCKTQAGALQPVNQFTFQHDRWHGV